MDAVIDSNIVISALIRTGGSSCETIFSDKLNLFAPEFLKEEIEKHKEELLTKTGLAENELNIALTIIFSRIRIVPFSEFTKHIPDAKSACPDPKDTEYFALAMSLKCPLWSNDKRLKEQDAVRVINTTEMIEFLK